MNESTLGQCFQRCGPFDSRHGCHKAGVIIEGNFIGVLSHNDISPKKNRGKHGENDTKQKPKKIKNNNNSRELGG